MTRFLLFYANSLWYYNTIINVEECLNKYKRRRIPKLQNVFPPDSVQMPEQYVYRFYRLLTRSSELSLVCSKLNIAHQQSCKAREMLTYCGYRRLTTYSRSLMYLGNSSTWRPQVSHLQPRLLRLSMQHLGRLIYSKSRS